ncbi:glycine--tRNA ligase [Halococcoides cellulosivorans]|uniref:glycine--tRNA ligase n=1 Tax=Halococcoides cellulosivorans TaxID=1679096 RepID=A0A2R4X279_9EURY|nr:glycine--tRNA ligase [Halococcoides cellulosivorans]AWB27897.1 glycine--tRNA ligase [Halococcoides cellulosivorans]
MADSEAVIELAKRRGFFVPTGEVYGGVSGFYTFGPRGEPLKTNLEATWRDRFVVAEGHMTVDAPTVLPEPVFEASGHLDGFADTLIECPECGRSHRADHLIEDHTDREDAESLPIERMEGIVAELELACPTCGTGLADQAIEPFNLMFETQIGPGSSDPGYLRPETAQGIFVEFPQLAEYARGQLPFGVAQIGRAYRNEISPRRSLIRVREFTQAELELFVHPSGDGPDLDAVADVTAPFYSAEAQAAVEDGDRSAEGAVRELTIAEAHAEGIVADPWIAYYLGVAAEWYRSIGVDMDRFRFRQHRAGERAHYASDCWDAESEIDGNWIELGGFADRGSYDLDKHEAHSGEAFTVFEAYDEPREIERATVDPDMSVLGPEFGGSAAAIADALEARAADDPAAFEAVDPGEAITVTVEDEAFDVPIEATGFARETVTESGEHVHPQVIEPSLGIDRALYTVIDHSLTEDEIDGEERTVLELPARVAPTTVAVFPLMDADGLDDRARAIVEDLRAAGLAVAYDDSGAIGRRYRRQDEIGTPYCVTVDYETSEDDTVTVRDRSSTDQVRVPIDELDAVLVGLRDGEQSFEEL